MPTPMKMFTIVASRYGVDPNDKDAVDKFFNITAPTLPVKEQQAILTELLECDGLPDNGLPEEI